MTASEIYELVKDWPREAWPEHVRWGGQFSFWARSEQFNGDIAMRASVAELAFEASGIAWLVERNREESLTDVLDVLKPIGVVKFIAEWDGTFGVDANDHNWYHGPTRLAAISAAVMAVKGQS